MPYIKQEHRARLDRPIRELADTMAEMAGESARETAVAGFLNYACTSLAIEVLRRRFGRVRYGHVALVTGVFKNVADEFYRRVGAPYEDRQIEKNGDLPLFRELVDGDGQK